MGNAKLAYIDATRGLAILMVVLVHQAATVRSALPIGAVLDQVARYGQLGVQLFFVASALTLCLSFDKRQDEERRLLKFYVRRFFRIAPMYYLAIALYFAVAVLFTGTSERFTPLNVAANLLFVHGFVPPALNDVVPGGWSIAGEMFFYAWFPFAFLISSWMYEKFGLWSICAIAITAFGLYALAWHIIPMFTVYEVERGNVFYYWAPAQVPVFLVGIAAYFLFRRFPPSKAWTNVVCFTVVTAATVVMWRSGYVAAFAWVPGMAAVSFVFLMRALSLARTVPGWLQAVGRASYSMYILHFLVVWFMAPVVVGWAAQFTISGSLVLILSYPLTVVAAYALSWISLRAIENPGISLGRQIIARLNLSAVASQQKLV